MQELNKVTLLPEYLEAVEELPKELQIKFLGEIALYGMTGVAPQFDDPILKAVFIAIRRVIDKSASFHKKQKQNGSKGGRPKKEESSLVEKPTQNPSETQVKPSRNPAETHLKPKKNRTSTSTCTSTCIYSDPQCGSDENVDLFGQKVNKPDLVLECMFYVWAFNRLTGKKYLYTQEKQKKFKTRRESFSFEDIITSEYCLGNQNYYLGLDDRGEPTGGWCATPDWHLQNNEHITRFLEMDTDGEYRQKSKIAIRERWELFMKETQGGKNV